MSELSSPYYLTRDRVEGVLSDKIEVWLCVPERLRCDDGDVMWVPPLDIVDRAAAYSCAWTLAQCVAECRVFPETDRECIRVGAP